MRVLYHHAFLHISMGKLAVVSWVGERVVRLYRQAQKEGADGRA
jgi:hypothetical protein